MLWCCWLVLSALADIVAYDVEMECAEQGKQFIAVHFLLTVCCCFLISRLTLLLDTVTYRNIRKDRRLLRRRGKLQH